MVFGVIANLKATLTSYSQLGELTDKGRQTTLELGQRLRQLYVDQLGFMPKILVDPDMIYLRATPMSRALERYIQSYAEASRRNLSDIIVKVYSKVSGACTLLQHARHHLHRQPLLPGLLQKRPCFPTIAIVGDSIN